jgi:hypothetical protein
MNPTRALLTISGVCLAMFLTACGGPKAGAYLFTVSEKASGDLIEGATVSIGPGDMMGRPKVEPVTGTTDERGQVMLALKAWSRGEMTVSFDGDDERFFVSPERIPAMNDPEETIRDARVIRFIRGTEPNDPGHFDVKIVRVRDGLEPPKR